MLVSFAGVKSGEYSYDLITISTTHGPLRYLSLSEDLSLLALLQARGEAGHDMLLCADHLHDLLVALYAHTLREGPAKRHVTGTKCGLIFHSCGYTQSFESR